MTNKNSTKRALLASIMAMLLCFTMLLGTTFAWFTDSVVSGSNVITAGNLDIVVEYTLGDKDENGEFIWNDLDDATKLFQKSLWEPGHTEVVVLRIKNNGTLALKYVANMNIFNETIGKTKDGEDIVLSDILTVSTLTIQADTAEEDALVDWVASVSLDKAFEKDDTDLAFGIPVAFKAGNVLESDKELYAGDSHYVFVKVDMADTVSNEANHDGKNIPSIEFGINVLATQFTYESDSFGNQYDKDAEYTISVATFEQLKAAFAKGGNIELTADIAFTEMLTIPKDVEVYLNMNGKTITPASTDADPLMDVKTGASLVIDGNGTFDLGDYKSLSLMYPRGDVTIKNGNFLRAAGTNKNDYGAYFVGINGGKGKLVIEGGYFDGGYYNESDCFNNCRTLLNGSWGQYIRVYGGTFVGQNPAWGDEGMADLCPHCSDCTYCQAMFLEGQTRTDTELPAGYTITEGTTSDGRPTYTVNYSK